MAEKQEDTKPEMEQTEGGDTSVSSEQRRRKVLIAVDGNNVSSKAVEWYLDDIYKEGDQIIFVHVFEVPLITDFEDITSPEQWTSLVSKQKDKTASVEKQLMRKLKQKKIEGGRFVVRGGGKPGEAIVSVAEEEQPDLVVMGSRGRGQAKKALLGSVSHFVLSNASCPVLIFKHKRNTKDKPAGEEKGAKED